jgi:hypothetical protein
MAAPEITYEILPLERILLTICFVVMTGGSVWGWQEQQRGDRELCYSVEGADCGTTSARCH